MRIHKIIALSILILACLQNGLAQSFDPHIISVSVDTLMPTNQGRVKITWNKVQHPDVAELQIYRYNGQSFSDIAIVEVRNVEYVDGVFAQAEKRSEGYRMASLTGNAAQNPILVDPHYTVFLQAESYDYCSKKITLTWSNYIGWADSLDTYKIYRKKGTQAYQLLTSISAFSDTVFTEQNVENNRIYKYYVVAMHKNGTQSLSNIVTVITDAEQTVDLEDLYIDTLRYNGAEVQIKFSGVQTDLISNYSIYKKKDRGHYDLLGRIENTEEARYRFSDNNPGNSGDFYRVGAFGLCDDSLGLSNMVRQVVLNGDMIDNVVRLTWNDGFTDIDADATVYMQVDGGEFKVLEQIEGKNSVEYNLIELGTSNSENFCFYISDELPIGYVSLSNTKCFTVEPVVDMPTAFTPNGDALNDYVLPEIKYADIEGYEFIVYDKYGGRIFETTSKDFKWDGRSYGKSVKEGAYLYYLKFTTRWGNNYEKSGVINVIYP